MKYVSYAWLVVKNIITLFIAWLLYSVATTSFEIIMVSLLLVIYAHLISSSLAIDLKVVISVLRSTKQFLHILQILKRNDPTYKQHTELMEAFKRIDENKVDYNGKSSMLSPFEVDFCEDEDSKESIKQQENDLNKLTIQGVIISVFTFLIYALAVWKIITTLS